ncbi:hypothetical protein AB3Z07_28230 (plasmid) [Metabacillus halosaccharovorans]|uniref:hypothetical protein n=1 Tax=Metabacillus halosaccharovorans TaxID=930124 RepID=UPI001C1F8827|nr:hypothetical protein [Metabacillus halosaccharovorans]MBU7595863.1 hypothetical protein [Metabacillus halosaccharovorans]
MTLKLIINNNKSKVAELSTCRNNCELFDLETGECGVNYKGDFDDPVFAARCGSMIYYDKYDDSIFIQNKPKQKLKYTLIEDEFECELEDENVYFDLQSNQFNTVNSTYPLEPDYPSRRDDTSWYVSPCGTWGCWIINKAHTKLVAVSPQVEFGWNRNVYKNPYPLHDHKASLSLASKMAWYVNGEGYGQYVLLGNGNIIMISSPKPKSWRSK